LVPPQCLSLAPLVSPQSLTLAPLVSPQSLTLVPLASTQCRTLLRHWPLLYVSHFVSLASPLCLTLCVFGHSSISLTCVVGLSSASVTCVVDICSASLAHAVCLSSMWLSCVVDLSSLSHLHCRWQILDLSLSCALTIDNIPLSRALMASQSLSLALTSTFYPFSPSLSLVLTASPLFPSLVLLVALLSLSLACRWPLLSSLSLTHTQHWQSTLCQWTTPLYSVSSLFSLLSQSSWTTIVLVKTTTMKSNFYHSSTFRRNIEWIFPSSSDGRSCLFWPGMTWIIGRPKICKW